MNDPYKYLAVTSAKKDVATLADIFGGATALVRTIGLLNNHGGAIILTQTTNLLLENGVHLSWNVQLTNSEVFALSQIYFISADLEWNEKAWKAMKEDYSDSLEKLVSLKFCLSPSLQEGKKLYFRIFQLVGDELVVFDESFRLLFITPLWASISLLPHSDNT